MAFTIYKSTDASAPTLSGTVGDLINLLDKCLVAGYGSKTAAGWTKPYTTTNVAVFRPASGSRFYLRVDDNGPGAGGAKEARAVGYETMSAHTTGTNLFPTAAQKTDGLFWRKSAAADATARDWWMYADGLTFYLFINTGDLAGESMSYAFGDFYSLADGDVSNCMIVGRTTENNGGLDQPHLAFANNTTTLRDDALAGHYMARGYNGTTGAISFGVEVNTPSLGAGTLLGGGSGSGQCFPGPNPADGALYLHRMYINDPTTIPVGARYGWFRGAWHLMNRHTVFPDQFQFAGMDDLAGKSFILQRNGTDQGGTTCNYLTFETSDTVDTN